MMTESPDFEKIIAWYFGTDQEDVSIAKGQIKNIVDESNFEANIFMLEFYRLDNDTGFSIDEENYAIAKYETFKTGFGRDYRYNVKFFVKYKGETAWKNEIEYSRYQIGNEQAYDALYAHTRDFLVKKGFDINHDLIVSGYKYAKTLQDQE